jgi:hypothetical protein
MLGRTMLRRRRVLWRQRCGSCWMWRSLVSRGSGGVSSSEGKQCHVGYGKQAWGLPGGGGPAFTPSAAVCPGPPAAVVSFISLL